jgi:hypothetical protein
LVAHMLWTTTGWAAPRVTLPILKERVGFLFGVMAPIVAAPRRRGQGLALY